MGVTRGQYLNNIITFKDSLMSPTSGTSPWELFPVIAIDNDPGAGFTVMDDFISLSDVATTGLWQITKGTGGSITLSSTSGTTIGGWVRIPTAASASDYQTFATQKAVFGVQNNMDLCFEALINVTEAATNGSSWYVGFTSVLTTGFLAAGVPASSFSGFVFYKTTGAMAINFMTSNGATQSTPLATGTAVTATSLILGAYCSHNDNVTAKITPYVGTVASNARTVVAGSPFAVQNLTIASLASMYFSFGIAAAAGGTAETLCVDYAMASQGRYYQ